MNGHTDAIVSNEKDAVVPGIFGLGVAGTQEMKMYVVHPT